MMSAFLDNPPFWIKPLTLILFAVVYSTLVFKGSGLLLKLLKGLASTTQTEIDDRLLRAAENPLRLLLITLGVPLFKTHLPETGNFVQQTVRLGLTVSLFWFLYNASELLKEGIQNFAKRAGRLNAEHIAEFLVKKAERNGLSLPILSYKVQLLQEGQSP